MRLAGCQPVRRTFDSQTAARSWARDEESRLERLRDRGGGRHTLAEAIERYYRTILPEKAETTQRTDERLLRWWYDNHGTLELAHITPAVLTAARDRVRQRASGPTANRYLAAISAVLSRAYREWGWMQENPTDRVGRFKESQGRVRWLTAEEIARLLDACARTWRPELRILVAIAFATGMRKGEILDLRWEDVDLPARLLVLHRTKNRDRRGVPVSTALVAELRKLPRRLDSPYLFPSAKPGSRERWSTYRKAWRKAVSDAGIRDFRFHDTRHSAASHLAMNGATERELMEILGHRSTSMVRRYSHLSKDHVRGVLESLGEAVLPPGGSDRSS